MELDADPMGEIRKARYGKLPEPVRLEDTIASQESNPPRDSEGGRDTDRDLFFRYAIGS